MNTTQTSPEPTTGSVGKAVVAALAGAIAALTVWRAFAAGAPDGGDGAQYLAHAWALLEGRPYGDTGYLFTQEAWYVGPAVYPPGTALLVAPTLAAFGRLSMAPLVPMYASLIVFVVCVAAVIARMSGRTTGAAVAAMVAASFLLADRAHVVGSDLPYCAAMWGTLWLVGREGRWSVRRSIAIAVVGSLAILFRVPAAPLIPAVLALGLLNRKSTGPAPFAVGVVWGIVLLYVLTWFGPETGNSSANALADAASTEGGTSRSLLERLPGRLSEWFTTYRSAASAAYLYPFPWSVANQLYHVVAILLFGVGLWGWVRTAWRSFGVLLSTFLGAMLLVAPVWEGRYLWVLTPFLIWGSIQGATVVWRRIRGARTASGYPRYRANRSATVTGIVVLALICAATAQTAIRPPPYFEPETERWVALGERLSPLVRDASEGVASNRPKKVAWFTGVPAMHISRSLDLLLAGARSRDIDLVVITRAVREPNLLPRWDDWRRENPGLFTLVHERGSLEIYRIDHERRPR